jgi:hypothetical protein
LKIASKMTRFASGLDPKSTLWADGSDRSEPGRPEKKSSANLADYPRLPQEFEEIADHVGRGQKDRQGQKQVGEVVFEESQSHGAQGIIAP